MRLCRIRHFKAGERMTTDKKPNPRGGTKMVRCPAHVHSMIIELQQLMAEQGDQAYYLKGPGQIAHGSVADAPLHIVVQHALEIAIKARHPDRDAMIEAHQARTEYLESFEEEETE